MPIATTLYSEIYFSISLGVFPITSGAPNTYVISSKLIPDHLLADLNGIFAITFNSLLDINFSLTASIVEFLSSEYFPKIPRISFSSSVVQSLYGIILSTVILPSVIVPVLSRHNTSTLANVSIQYNS